MPYSKIYQSSKNMFILIYNTKANTILLIFEGRAPPTRKLHALPPSPPPVFTKIRIAIELSPIFFLFRVVQEKIRISNRPLVYLLGEFNKILKEL